MSHVQASSRTRRTTSFEIRPFGQPLVMAFLGGAFAAEVEASGLAAAVDFATGELVRLFGSKIRGHIGHGSMTAWRSDPWTRGGYSATLPGQAHQRAVLAEPIADRIFFAGEACSIDSYSTCHGAYLTGVAAAEKVAAILGTRRDVPPLPRSGRGQG
jgi:monoamine oxidase